MIDRKMVASMEKGSVIVDISNDYGAIETFHETTHSHPTYVEEGVVHYCVSNIPAACGQSTSIAYAASVLPHFLSIIKKWSSRCLCQRWLPAPFHGDIQRVSDTRRNECHSGQTLDSARSHPRHQKSDPGSGSGSDRF